MSEVTENVDRGISVLAALGAFMGGLKGVPPFIRWVVGMYRRAFKRKRKEFQRRKNFS